MIISIMGTTENFQKLSFFLQPYSELEKYIDNITPNESY